MSAHICFNAPPATSQHYVDQATRTQQSMLVTVASAEPVTITGGTHEYRRMQNYADFQDSIISESSLAR